MVTEKSKVDVMRIISLMSVRLMRYYSKGMKTVLRNSLVSKQKHSTCLLLSLSVRP